MYGISFVHPAFGGRLTKCVSDGVGRVAQSI